MAERYEAEKAIAFLKGLLEEIETSRTIPLQPKETTESIILLQSSVASSYITLDRNTEVESILKKCERTLDDVTGVDIHVSGAFYKVAARYYQKKADYGEYYKMALLFLGCVKELEGELGREECGKWAYDLALATILREAMANFGELVCFFCWM